MTADAPTRPSPVAIFAGLVAALAGAAAAFTMSDAPPLPRELLFWDDVWQQRSYVALSGCSLPQQRPQTPWPLLVRVNSLPPAANRITQLRAGIYLHNAPPGEYRMNIAGMPYSHLGFAADAARLIVLPAGSSLAIIDERLLRPGPSGTRPKTLPDLSALPGDWYVAAFSLATGREFSLIKKALRDELFWPRRQPALALVAEASGELARQTVLSRARYRLAPQARFVVVTGDEQLARQAAGMRYAVALVGPGDQEGPMPAEVRRIDSLLMLPEVLGRY
jgi:hypothetical protein